MSIMRRSLLLIIILLPALCAFGKNNPHPEADSVVVDSSLYYRAEIKMLEDSIAQLRSRIIADAATIEKKTKELNDFGKSWLKIRSEKDSINNELKKQTALMERLHKAFESDAFYTLLLYLPITARFDSVDIANKKDFIETLHLAELHPDITKIYYDMMVNYQTYLKEVTECVGYVLDEFRLNGNVKPDIDYVQGLYTTKLEHTQYWEKRHVGHKRTEIPFLEKRLFQIDELFLNEASFSKDAFQKIYDDLIRR